MNTIQRAGLAIVMALFATSAAAQDQRPRSDGVLSAAVKAYAVTAALDAGTTYASLSRGASEANPLLHAIGRNNPLATTSVLVASDIGALYAWKKVADAGHPRIAVVGLVASSVFRAWVVHHNFQTLAEQRR